MGMAARLASLFRLFGLDFGRMIRSLRGLRPYFRNRDEWKRQLAAGKGKDFPMGRPYPCLSDRFEESGVARGAYFHQDLHVAQLIFANRPVRHIDLGSRVDGFVAHVASFREIEVFDIRNLVVSVKNITFRQRDIMLERPDLDECTDSLSCLHTLEHFGLGRYGDPVDADGHLKGWQNLYRMLKPGGKFYFSTPIGPQRVDFDGQRVFSVPYIVGMMSGKYRIDSFSYVNDAGDFFAGVDPRGPGSTENFGCIVGTGIFELTKL